MNEARVCRTKFWSPRAHIMLLQRSNVGPSGDGPTFLGAVLADP